MAAERPSGHRVSRLVLASGSPRRLELLRLASLEPVLRPADIDEAPFGEEDAVAYVTRLAGAKASAVPRTVDEVVLAADTTVVLDRTLLGKPDDAEEATSMLHRLSGRSHQVFTAVTVLGPDGQLHQAVATTEVWFASLPDSVIDAYVATGEPFGKAGGYGIQGRASVFVERIQGSWTNVVGLPVVEALRLLADAGFPAPGYGQARSGTSQRKGPQ